MEALPPRLKWLILPPTNLGSYSRKRVTAFAFVINTNGQPCTFTPLVDNQTVSGEPGLTFITTVKTTVIYYYNQEVIGTDYGGTLASRTPFEYYGPNIEETVSEKCPVPMEYLVIPSNDYGHSKSQASHFL